MLLNRAQYPSDVIALVVPWRLRYKLSLRDLAERHCHVNIVSDRRLRTTVQRASRSALDTRLLLPGIESL